MKTVFHPLSEEEEAVSIHAWPPSQDTEGCCLLCWETFKVEFVKFGLTEMMKTFMWFCSAKALRWNPSSFSPWQLLWKQAQTFPLFPALGEMESHMFECVNQAAVHEELEDETRRLCDVRPFLPVLKLVMRNCGRAERLLDSKIGVLIGKGEAPSKTFPQFKRTDYHTSSFPDWSLYCTFLTFPVKKST